MLKNNSSFSLVHSGVVQSINTVLKHNNLVDYFCLMFNQFSINLRVLMICSSQLLVRSVFQSINAALNSNNLVYYFCFMLNEVSINLRHALQCVQSSCLVFNWYSINYIGIISVSAYVKGYINQFALFSLHTKRVCPILRLHLFYQFINQIWFILIGSFGFFNQLTPCWKQII